MWNTLFFIYVCGFCWTNGTFAHCILVWVIREHNANTKYVGQHFTPIEKRQSRSVSIVGINLPGPPGSSQSIGLLCTSPVLQQRDLVPSLWDRYSSGAGQGRMIHRLKHNKGAHAEPETETDFSIQGGRSTQAVSILSPYRSVSGHGPFLHHWEEVKSYWLFQQFHWNYAFSTFLP